MPNSVTVSGGVTVIPCSERLPVLRERLLKLGAYDQNRKTWTILCRMLQLSVHVARLRTLAGLNAQPTIGPELPFAAEAMRRLHQCDQAGGSNRTDAGNLM